MLKTYTIAITELEKGTTTFQAPPDFDGTISISKSNDTLSISFNSDFVENYEQRLNQQG